MSTLQYVFLSLVMVTVALEAKKILRAQEGVPTTGKFMVSLDLDTPTERFEELAEKIENEAEDQNIHKIDGQFVKVISAKLSETALEKIKNEANVRYIEEEQVIKIRPDIDMPLSDNVQEQQQQRGIPWHLDRIDQRHLPLDGRFSLNKTGAGVDIYILDTGIRYSHEEFGGRAKYVGVDVIDLLMKGQAPKREGEDCDGHGTHVAALAGGATYGVAKDATLYSVRVMTCTGGGTTCLVLMGLEVAGGNITDSLDSRPGIISMSLGLPLSKSAQLITDTVNVMLDQGIHIVVSAGNNDEDSCKQTPAASRAITVGATNSNDQRAYFSSYGSCVDVFAPGVDILSAGFKCDNCSARHDGTSMSTPIVTGVVATLLEGHPEAHVHQTKGKLLDIATGGVVKKLRPGSGSPNRLLYAKDEIFVPPQDSLWPSGPYSLPAPAFGCPSAANYLGVGYVFQDNEDTSPNKNAVSDPLSMAGYFDEDTLTLYCTYDVSNSHDWPSGSYCLAQYTDQCPHGFTTGRIYWDDENDNNANMYEDYFPRGADMHWKAPRFRSEFDSATSIYYCCRNDSATTSQMTLPTAEPFYLYQYDSAGCQGVVGMKVRQEWRQFDNENHWNFDMLFPPHPHIIKDDANTTIKLFFCYYY